MRCPYLCVTTEKASIDEAFIDFTQPVRDEILRRYPYLAQVPPDAPDGADSPLPPPPPIMWNGLGTVIPVNGSAESTSTDSTEQDDHGGSEDNDGVVNGNESTTWHDVALAIAAELMGKIRCDIHERLGYSTSAVGGMAVARRSSFADKCRRVSLGTSSSLRSSSVWPVTGLPTDVFHSSLRHTRNPTTRYKRLLLNCSPWLRKYVSQSILRNAAIPSYLRPLPFQKVLIALCGGTQNSVGHPLDSFPRRQTGQSDCRRVRGFHGRRPSVGAGLYGGRNPH